MLTHSIISWDCSNRDFFHLIDGLLDQKYDRSQFELIYVEQRSKNFADTHNHKLGLKSLSDRYQEIKDQMDIQIIYLGDEKIVPYHLGRCNNKGIELAKGKIISIMDGDLLLPPDFLKNLEKYHKNHKKAVVNIFRHTANYPVGVKKENWTKGIIDFEQCLAACPTRNDRIPRTVSNKGPLISARKEYWKVINGYDLHPIWSTGLSRLGQDVNARLEILTGFRSITLPNTITVHPYHPAGFKRNVIKSQRLLDLQQKLIDWAITNEEPSWKKRIIYTEKLYNNNRNFVNKMIYSDFLRVPGENKIRKLNSLLQTMNIVLGKFHKLYKVTKKFEIFKKINAGSLKSVIKKHDILYKMALRIFKTGRFIKALFYTREQRYLFLAKRHKYKNLRLQKISQQARRNVKSWLNHMLKKKNISKTPNFYSNALRPEIVYTFQHVINSLIVDFDKINYLEIGSCQGVSLTIIALILQNKGFLNDLVSIDPYFESGYIEGGESPWKKSKNIDINKTTKGIALSLYKHFNFNVELIEDISSRGLMHLVKEGRKFQLIYIDASHERFNPLIDFGLSTFLIAQGGIIMLDDHHWPDVKFVKKLCDKHLEKIYECWKIAAYKWKNKD